MSAQECMSQTIEAELAAQKKTKNGLANRLNINRRNLYQRFANEKSWSFGELEVVATFLGMSVWQLVALAASRSVLSGEASAEPALAAATATLNHKETKQ
ncbi:hypothetical protein CS006_10555 [Bifidobacterium primatium]|uniref:HTH cro/C1-type domain-containing protein n=1 Tax=Bifidobacterium primatium TaxID=2045438 RepID=A0A2M9H6D6_9BIFI|nr:hypothetical protein [Bifidobacterium primatium]PJM72368.1 hypothetical protein CS006_10555 [Bifidobacterium primatium]